MTADKNFRVAGFTQGKALKAPVVVATDGVIDGNIVLSGLQIINGYQLLTDDRILVKDQTDTIENGIYNASISAWTRDGDWDGDRDATNGTLVSVVSGIGPGSVVLWQANCILEYSPGVNGVTFTELIYTTPAEAQTLEDVTVLGNTTTQGIDVTGGAHLRVFNIIADASLDIDVTNVGGPINVVADADLAFSALGTMDFDLDAAAAFTFSIDNSAALSIQDHIVRVNTDSGGFLDIRDDLGSSYRITAATTGLNFLPNATIDPVRYLFQPVPAGEGMSFQVAEMAAAPGDVAGYGQFWVRDDAPNVPMFTDDTGVDFVLNDTGVAAVNGAKVYHSANQVIGGAGADVVLAFNSEAYDTDTIHDTSTNNSRLTVPTGVTRFRLRGNVRWQASSSSYRSITIRKNGAGGTIDDAMIWQPRQEMTANVGPNSWDQQIVTGVLTAVATDYFELLVRQGSGGNLNAESSETWFEMEIIE